MATHPRQEIREAVVARLLDATRAQSRVYPTREVPWRRTELPAIAVYALSEGADSSRIPGDYVRTVAVAILACVSVSDKVDDELDAIALEIETAIATDTTFGGKAVDAYLTETVIEVTEEQGRPLGAVRLTYDVRYQTSA